VLPTRARRLALTTWLFSREELDGAAVRHADSFRLFPLELECEA